MRDPLPEWAADYSKVPFRDMGRDHAGCDCWGLHGLILKERAGVEMPDFDGRYEGTTAKQDGPVIEGLIQEGLGAGFYHKIANRTERLFDGLLYRIEGLPMHVATILAPGTAMHCIEGRGTCLLRYRLPVFQNVVLGFYRHRSLI